MARFEHSRISMIIAAVVLAIVTRLLAEVVLARTDVDAVVSPPSPTSRAALARGAEAPRYGIQPRVAVGRGGLIHRRCPTDALARELGFDMVRRSGRVPDRCRCVRTPSTKRILPNAKRAIYASHYQPRRLIVRSSQARRSGKLRRAEVGKAKAVTPRLP